MNQKELKELIEFLIEKDIAEFELERGDVKVRIKRGAGEHTVVHTHSEPRFYAVPPAPGAVPELGAVPVAVPARGRTCRPCSRTRASYGEVPDRGHILRSPVAGRSSRS